MTDHITLLKVTNCSIVFDPQKLLKLCNLINVDEIRFNGISKKIAAVCIVHTSVASRINIK